MSRDEDRWGRHLAAKAALTGERWPGDKASAETLCGATLSTSVLTLWCEQPHGHDGNHRTLAGSEWRDEPPRPLPDVLEAVVLGPEDRLVLLVDSPMSPDQAKYMRRSIAEVGLTDRVLGAYGMDAFVIRATKAEGSTVGQCGDEYDVTAFGLGGGIDEYELHRCHLAYGHTGLHSDGEATWSNEGASADA